jgi:hypothetical protein
MSDRPSDKRVTSTQESLQPQRIGKEEKAYQAMVARLVVVTPVGTPEGTMMVMVWTRTRSRAIEGNGEICSPFLLGG